MEWEKQVEENRRLKTELDKIQASYSSLKEVEGMLHKTLQQAEQSTKDTLDNARKRASLIVAESESKSRELLRQGVEQRNQIDKEINELCERRDEILMQLSVFLKTQTDRLSNFGRKTGIVTPITVADLEKGSITENLFASPISKNGKDEKASVDEIVEQL
jgi:cell division initiation protein